VIASNVFMSQWWLLCVAQLRSLFWQIIFFRPPWLSYFRKISRNLHFDESPLYNMPCSNPLQFGRDEVCSTSTCSLNLMRNNCHSCQFCTYNPPVNWSQSLKGIKSYTVFLHFVSKSLRPLHLCHEKVALLK